MKQGTLSFNTRQLFRPIGTHQWYPPHAFGAQGSADHLDWFAITRPQRGLQKEFFKKSHSGLRPLSSGLRLFQVASTMVQILIRDSDLTVRTSLQPVIVIVDLLKIELIQTL